MRARTTVIILLVILCPAAWAKDRSVTFKTIPPGAQVEVNGSISCTTPCSIQVDGEYFGVKWTRFSKRAKTPITVRLSKDGCAPKTFPITSLLHYQNNFGMTLYSGYEVLSQEFNVRLDRIDNAQSSSAGPEKTGSNPCQDSDPGRLKEMLDSARQSVVTVSAGKESATGFVLSSDGLIVTDATPIEDHDSFRVTLPDGRLLKTSKFYLDSDQGIALLKVEAQGLDELKLDPTIPHPGDDVFTVEQPSAPQSTALTPDSRTVVIASFDDSVGGWIHTAQVMSAQHLGSPLLNREGQVIGIFTRKEAGLVKDQTLWIGARQINEFVGAHFKIVTPAVNQTAQNLSASGSDCSTTIVSKLEDGTPVYEFKGGQTCGVSPPRIAHQQQPKYTKQARKQHITGTVQLSLVVDTKGEVRDVKVTRSLEPSLDEAATNAVKAWRFEPAMKDGKSVAVQVQVETKFTLYSGK